MRILDFVALHNLCGMVCERGVSPESVFGEPNAEGYRESIWGGLLHQSNYEAFLSQCAVTLQAVNLKAGFVASWKKENGQ